MPIRSKLVMSWRTCLMAALLLLSALLGVGMSHAQSNQRLITLAPHLTELAFASGAGETLVGVVAYSNYPPQAQALPQIGDAFRFDLEAIVSEEPTHALAWRGGTPTMVAEQLESIGIDVVWIQTESFEDIAQALMDIAGVAGDVEAAQQVADDFLGQIARWKEQQDKALSEAPVEIFYQISARPLYTFGGRHVINEVFETCGGRNVFVASDIEALSVDREAVLHRQPNLIIAGLPEHEDPSQNDPLNQWMPYQQGALANTQFHRVDPNLLVRPTPRILEGVERLCGLIAQIRVPSTP